MHFYHDYTSVINAVANVNSIQDNCVEDKLHKTASRNPPLIFVWSVNHEPKGKAECNHNIGMHRNNQQQPISMIGKSTLRQQPLVKGVWKIFPLLTSKQEGSNLPVKYW